MTKTRRIALAWILLACGISIGWGFSVGQNANGWVDFRAVYYGTRCLLEHHNPYKVRELESVYRAEGGERPSETVAAHQAVVLYVNVPTLFIVVTPFAMLPWGPAHLLWLAITAGFFILAALLMWNVGASYAPHVSLFLIFILLANCESIFGAGNTAGIAVGLCVVAVWCFIRERFVLAGVLCMALSLAIKPHDAGLVWLYFLLAGGVYRKRALQTLFITVVLGLAAFLWVSHVAPHWIQDWQSNLATISAPGGINEPGPDALTGRSAFMVIDLQAAISIFRDNPRIYNPASYIVCAALLLAWAVRTLRASFSPARAWIALAAVAPLTMLVTYHRPWDAKLLMLTIPACAMLWAQGGRIRWIALLVNSAGLLLNADVTLAILSILFNKLHVDTTGIFGKMLALVMIRPASLILLVMSIFYLWVYLRRDFPQTENILGSS
ncbi:MAG: glycosyltransferase family 87 protein [Terracidiphilus sp.]